jgi:hypothetical protein
MGNYEYATQHMDDQKKFHAWISHFAQSISGITPNNQHLLILDGHGSHVTLKWYIKHKL